MLQHDLRICEKVPYTAYYAIGTWSWQIRCPSCGNVRRQHINTDGRGEMLCNGREIAKSKAN